MTKIKYLFLIGLFILYGCGSQAEPPSPTSAPATATIILPTETQTAVPITETPALTQDPLLFGAILQTEIQAFSLEPFANAIFTKTMDGYIASDNILEYQVTRVTVFPAGDGTFFAELTYNVRTTDTSWLVDGGTQATDNWIQDKCNRFDFVTTETEFQLKNRRLCN